MKAIKFLLPAIFMISFMMPGKANTVVPVTNSEIAQIKSVIQKIDFDEYIDHATTVKLQFMINTQNEIVILSTDNKDLDEVLKEKLSYSKIKIKELRYDTVYTLPVTIN
jgi:hypothetical protein